MKIKTEHPFITTIGQGPYKLVDFFQLIKPSEYNPRGNFADIPKNLKSGVGSCAHCGTGILNNFIIQSAKGDRFAVGCECVKKLNLPYEEMTKFEKMAAKHEREKRAARLEKKGKEAREVLQVLLYEYADLLKEKQYNHKSNYFDYISFCLKHMGNTNIQGLANRIKKITQEAKNEGS